MNEVLELVVLLPQRQVAILESLAHRQGMTVGQFVRRLIRGHIEGRTDAPTIDDEPVFRPQASR